MRLSVPGNILLLGEYAVLEEGGLGLAMAVERRVRVSTQPAEGLIIEGAWPGGSVAWTQEVLPARAPGASPGSSLAAAAVEVVQEWLSGQGSARSAWDLRIRIDSSELFRADGRKSGLGSSAAVTVGLVCALLEAAGVRAGARDAAAPELALRAHRRAQEGAGSGYDVTCSYHGGSGIFHGGLLPSWEPCKLAWDPSVLLFMGPSPVSTSDAVRAYLLWKKRNPEAAKEFLEESNRAVLDFVQAVSDQDAARRFACSRWIGTALGDAIGIPARIKPPSGLDPGLCKAVGAGNELGACLIARDAPAPADSGEIQRVRLSREGVVWEE